VTVTDRTDRGVLPEDVPIGETRTIVCAGCGEQYEWTSREGWQWPTVYCTKACKRRASYARRVKLADPEQAAPGMRLLWCARCGLPFGWTPRDPDSSSDAPPRVCGDTCRIALAVKRRKARAAEKAAAKAVPTPPPPTEAERLARAEEEAEATRRSEMADAARALLLPATHCVPCGKVASLTKDAAKAAKRAVEQRTGRTNEVRYYECPEGFWHWTSQVHRR
jgi:hypothetical protein